MQASQEKPLLKTPVPESTDIAYSVRRGSDRVHVAIGEFKRCLIQAEQWQNSNLKGQLGLSRELRGYGAVMLEPTPKSLNNDITASNIFFKT